MRLIAKEMSVNPETFAPELVVTIGIPLEQKKDGEHNENEEYRKIGKQLVELVIK